MSPSSLLARAAPGILSAGLLWGAAAAEEPRNPFWPVGYRPARAEEPAPDDGGAGPADREARESARREEAWQKARSRITIQGTSRRGDGLTVAVINGRAVETGGRVRVLLEEEVFEWRVTGIDSQGVNLERVRVRPKQGSENNQEGQP